MVSGPARPRPRRQLAWILPVLIGIGVWIGLLWVSRPRWSRCVDSSDPELSFCDSGLHSLGAIVGTITLAALFVVYLLLVALLRGPARRGVLIAAIAVLAIACLVVAGLELFTIREPIRPHVA